MRSFDNGLHFDTGKAFWPLKVDPNGATVRDADGHTIKDLNFKADSDAFIGDYGYCNKSSEPDVFICYAIHNDVVQAIPIVPAAPASEPAPALGRTAARRLLLSN